ncbi:MAG: PAS domain-containing protein [Chloroflexi bacterium]|nr:PAS domain-containing protein [Chloroflexota bacterium]
MEEALRQSEEKYRLIAENTSDGIVVWDIQKEAITFASPSYEAMMGRTFGDLDRSALGRTYGIYSSRRPPKG